MNVHCTFIIINIYRVIYVYINNICIKITYKVSMELHILFNLGNLGY